MVWKYLAFLPQRATSINAMKQIDLLGPNARAVAANGGYPGIPLSALGTVHVVPSKTGIYRRNGDTFDTIFESGHGSPVSSTLTSTARAA